VGETGGNKDSTGEKGLAGRQNILLAMPFPNFGGQVKKKGTLKKIFNNVAS
jgi:hypothetical protein